MTRVALDEFDLDLRIDDSVKPTRYPGPTQTSCACSFRTRCEDCTTGIPVGCTG
jgi:hypothetical protein